MRILFVEDEAKLAETIAGALRQAGHAVEVAGSVTEARDRLGSTRCDAMVLDVMLPDGSGFDLTQELRESGDSIPILMLTALDAVEDRVTGLNRGADDYLVKPFALTELLARLRALGRRRATVRPPSVQVADLVVDAATHTATRAGRTIELTTTEYTLLEHLALHAGQVCNRASISAEVWGESRGTASNLIDVYVARLRRKIDTPGEIPLIHTTHGVGYSLRDA